MSTTQDTLLELSHFLGEEKRQLAILGEGNTLTFALLRQYEFF